MKNLSYWVSITLSSLFDISSRDKLLSKFSSASVTELEMYDNKTFSKKPTVKPYSFFSNFLFISTMLKKRVFPLTYIVLVLFFWGWNLCLAFRSIPFAPLCFTSLYKASCCFALNKDKSYKTRILVATNFQYDSLTRISQFCILSPAVLTTFLQSPRFKFPIPQKGI